MTLGHTPRLAVCAGSFDPVTNGHVDMFVRAAGLFDRVVVAVLANSAKQPWFSVEERLTILRDVLRGSPSTLHVEVDAFDGLLVDYVKRRGAVAVVRGLRTTSEFSEESQMALMNRHLHAGFETVFLVPAPAVSYISSRLVKEVAALGGPLDGLVPPAVVAALARRRHAGQAERA